MPRSITGTLRHHPSRLAALLAAPVATAALLAGCGVGQISQTDRMVAAVPGTDVDSAHHAVSLRDMVIRYNGPEGYPTGGSAPLVLFISNNQTDRSATLKSVTATDGRDGPPIGTVVLAGGTAEIGVKPSAAATAPGTASASGRPTVTASAGASGSASASAGASASAEPTASATQPAGSANLNLRIPASGYARLTPEAGGGYLAITGLTKALGPGSQVWLTFTFDVDEPVGAPVSFGVPLSAPARVAGSNAPAE